MAQIERLPDTVDPVEPSEAAAWIRKNRIILAAVAMLAVQLWWKAGLLAHFYFQQGDFPLIDRAVTARLSPRYLFTPVSGQLAPGVRALAWVEARTSLYDWTLAAALTLALLALAGLALLRMLRMLFGGSPAVLVLFAIYLSTPLTLPGLSWWSSALGWLPLQLAMFAAITSHLRYVKTGKAGSLVAAACWLLAGMLFAGKAVLVPLLLFAVTSAFLTTGSWAAGAILALRAHWRAWLSYALLTAGYLVVIVIALSRPALTPNRIPAASSVLDLAAAMLRSGFVPAALGGPWRWHSVGGYALAAHVPVITELSWAAAAAIVLASLWLRKRAWRAWAILAGWLVIADFLTVVVGRSGITVSALLGTDLSFLADSVPVLILCVGLAFLPVDGETTAYHLHRPSRQTRTLLAGNVLVVVLAGALWSAHAYQQAATGAPARSYIATARAALAQAPPGAVILSTPVPQSVMNPAFFGRASLTRAVLGPLARPAWRVHWTALAAGSATPLIFDGVGRLWPAVVVGPASVTAPGKSGCWSVRSTQVQIPLVHSLYRWSWTAQIRYSGPATTLEVRFGGAWQTVTVPSGSHDVFVPAPGAGGAVTIAPTGLAGCVTRLTVGTMQASVFGQPVPAVPVRG